MSQRTSPTGSPTPGPLQGTAQMRDPVTRYVGSFVTELLRSRFSRAAALCLEAGIAPLMPGLGCGAVGWAMF